MNEDVPTVRPDARLEEIVRALESSYRRRVVVLDADRRVLGIITDGDLLRRSRYAQDLHGLLRRLHNLVTRQKEQMVTLPYARGNRRPVDDAARNYHQARYPHRRGAEPDAALPDQAPAGGG